MQFPQQMVYRYSYVLNNPTRYTDPTGNAYNGGTWSYGAGATFAANYNNHTAEYAAWEQFFNAEKDDMMRELMPQSGGGSSIAEVNMGEGYTAIWDNSSSAFVQNYYAFRAGLIRYRYEHIISGTYLLPEVVIYVKRSAQRGGGMWDKIVNTAGLVADYTIMLPIDFTGAAYDFGSNYYDMRNANFRNSDKYFHAKANFQATHRGPGGQFFAEHFSNLREIWDQNVKGYPRSDSELDQKANLFGPTQTNFFAPYDYREALKIYRPRLLPAKY